MVDGRFYGFASQRIRPRLDRKSDHGSLRLGTSIRDRDGAYGEVFIRRLRSMGIRDRPTSPRSPWQNGYAERLIGSIRRECLDHVVVFSERHLRHLLLSYMKYYNGARTHLSLEKDAPVSRAVDRAGRILCRPTLGGLHHQYARI
jgi:transposase InsO family protein